MIWSSLGVFVRKAGLDVQVILLYSTGFSVVIQSVIFTKRRFRKAIPDLKRMPSIMLLAVVLLINNFTFLLAYQKTSFAKAVLTHYTAPVIVVVLGYLFLRERATRMDLFALSVAMLGLWIMFGGGGLMACLSKLSWPPSEMSQESLGVVSGFVSAFFYALLVVMIRAYVRDQDPYVLVFFQNLFVVFCLLPFFEYVPWKALILLFVMGLIHSTLAPYLYYYGLKGVQAHRAAVLGYLEPIGSIVSGMIFFNEWPSTRVYLGGVLILLAGYMTIHEKEVANA